MNTAMNTTEKICGLWSTLLSTEVHPDDNFFELGGYSLLLMRMVMDADDLGIVIAPEQVIDYPTPASLAKAIENEA